nr:hypothetical protein Iba_chr12eCG15930 [Ipomoea batatas]
MSLKSQESRSASQPRIAAMPPFPGTSLRLSNNSKLTAQKKPVVELAGAPAQFVTASFCCSLTVGHMPTAAMAQILLEATWGYGQKPLRCRR